MQKYAYVHRMSKLSIYILMFILEKDKIRIEFPISGNDYSQLMLSKEQGSKI